MTKQQLDALFQDINQLLKNGAESDEWHVSHGRMSLANDINNVIYEHWWSARKGQKPS